METNNKTFTEEMFDSYISTQSLNEQEIKYGPSFFMDDIREALKLIIETNRLLLLDDSFEKLKNLIDIKRSLVKVNSIFKMRSVEYPEFLDYVKMESNWFDNYGLINVDSEIERLKDLNSIGSLLKTNQPVIKRFETTLNNDERLDLCNDIISESASNKPKYDKTFTGPVDKPTLNYLLGGEEPDKIIKIQMSGSHQNVYDLLLKHSNHKNKDGEKCIPPSIRMHFLPLVLLSKEGKPINKLNNDSTIKE